MTAEKRSRRSVLRTGGAAGAAALAACARGGNPPAQPSAVPTSRPGEQPGPEVLAELSAVPVGGAISATMRQGQHVILSRPNDDVVVGLDATCTHMGCTVAPQGAVLRCPCHGSVFDAFTGAVEHGPAASPLSTVAVRVDNGRIIHG